MKIFFVIWEIIVFRNRKFFVWVVNVINYGMLQELFLQMWNFSCNQSEIPIAVDKC